MREGHNLTIHLVHEANQNWVSCSFSRSHFMFYVTRNTWSRMERERKEKERGRVTQCIFGSLILLTHRPVYFLTLKVQPVTCPVLVSCHYSESKQLIYSHEKSFTCICITYQRHTVFPPASEWTTVNARLSVLHWDVNQVERKEQGEEEEKKSPFPLARSDWVKSSL